jgi:ribosomal protein S18 acetylase RimI-like enzyme
VGPVIGSLRPATSNDSEFCYTLHRQSLGEVVAEVFGGWDDAVQRDFHAAWFEPARLNIIQDSHGTPLGVLDVREEFDHTYLSRIELLPEYQNRGIGSAVIQDLLADGREVRLHVFTVNVRARRLYERLGFRVDSERDGRLEMIAHAD